MQPKPLGGWLMLFVCTLFISSILILWSPTEIPLAFWTDAPLGLQALMALYTSQGFALLWTAYLAGFKRKTGTIRTVIILIWIFVPSLTLIEGESLRYMLETQLGIHSELMSRMISEIELDAMIGVIYCLIWSIYLKKSKRVKATYILP